MRRRFHAAVASLLALLALPIEAVTPYTAKLEIEKNFTEIFGDTSKRTWTEDRRVLLTLVGRTKPIPGASPNAVVDKLGAFLGAPLDLRQNVEKTIGLPRSIHYEFSQFVAGQRVENASLYFDMNRQAQIIGLFNETKPGLRLLNDGPRLSSEAGKCFAAAALLEAVANCDVAPPDQPRFPPGADALQFLSVTKTVFAVPPFARWAWAVEVRSLKPRASRRYVIDATGGFVLEVSDRFHRAHDAQVFIPSPFTNPKIKTLADIVPKDPAYQSVTLSRLNAPAKPDRHLLEGSWVVVQDFAESFDFPKDYVVSADGNFVFERGSSGFAATMAYHHIDAMQDYVQTLGLTNVASRPIMVDIRPDGLATIGDTGYENVPVGSGFIVFGYRHAQGRIFAAEDADVIAHEYGHALQSALAFDSYDKGNAETRAMYEGFGDYWAMTVFYETKVKHGLDPLCFGEWLESATSGTRACLREINLLANRSHFDPSAKAHKNGAIWTAALWAIRRELGKKYTDELVLSSHVSVPPGARFEAGVQAIFTADEGMTGGKNVKTLCRIFTERFLTCDARCSPPPEL